MEFLPTYDELWAVSDLHLGGEKSAARNFQIFRRGERLGNFIRFLSTTRPGDEVALVLNGDVIDSLAEKNIVPKYVALDVDVANALMKHIYDDPSFAPVWTALRDFVHTPKRTLVVIVGNHDIELALRVVETSIRQRLAEGDPAANSRILFSTHGGGFGCRVGPKRVFCTHGNEVDEWNTVDYNELGQLDNAITAGRRVDPAKWVPNAGTRLVIDLMNQAKARYPFVDLLKPETNVAMSVVLAVDPSLVRFLDASSLLKIREKKKAGEEETANLLSAQGTSASVSASVSAMNVDLLFSAALAEHVSGLDAEVSEDALLIAAEVRMMKGESPLALVVDSDGATLSVLSFISSAVERLKPNELLRRKLLDWMGEDTTFKITDRDSTYQRIIPRAGPGVDFVVTGHTHLARSIEDAGGRHYFNCGTWIRLIRLTLESLENLKVFEQGVLTKLAAGSMDVLDTAMIRGKTGEVPLVLDRTTAVRIFVDKDDQNKVKGELLRVTGGEDGKVIKTVKEEGGLEA